MKDFIQPAKKRPQLPKRMPQSHLDRAHALSEELDSAKAFKALTTDVHLECHQILQSTQAAYVKACGELGLKTTSRREVIVQ